MIKYSSFILLFFILTFQNVKSQSALDSTQLNKELFSLDEALKSPDKVYRLNLSNQKLELSDTILSKFTNLQYLSLENDHLTQVPAGIVPQAA